MNIYTKICKTYFILDFYIKYLKIIIEIIVRHTVIKNNDKITIYLVRHCGIVLRDTAITNSLSFVAFVTKLGI